MSILFKGNLEEGNYTLIKSTDGWVLKGETSYVGFNFADRPQGKWFKDDEGTFICSACGSGYKDQPTIMGKPMFEWCPICGAKMKGADDE